MLADAIEQLMANVATIYSHRFVKNIRLQCYLFVYSCRIRGRLVSELALKLIVKWPLSTLFAR